MVKLRHINGNNLPELEKQLELIELPFVVHSINKVGGNWYIHFLLTGTVDEKKPIKKVKAKKTKTVRSERGL